MTPIGTITFLLSDIEGSTPLWEQFPEAMTPALARHDAILRATVEANQGAIVKLTGDGMLAVFHTAPDALRAALDAQKSLQSEPWADYAGDGVGLDPAPANTFALRVRMGVHTGAAEARDGDYFGPAVNRVARLMATAHGGQTVLSMAAQELTRDALPPDVVLHDLGEHRLKDLGRPENVFQLLHPALRSDFPPLRSLDNAATKHNLPQQVTSFVGRESEIAAAEALLTKTRLLTITGAGGSGKTRLALQIAANRLDDSADGVWLVELAPLADPGLVPQTVANALGIKPEPGKTVIQALVENLRESRLLLLLDNCEHLLDACATLADALIRHCPQTSLLATSREALGIAGERAYRIPSLSLPDPNMTATPENVGQSEAVRLFVERADLQQSGFAVTGDNAAALAAVCHRLDGIPLAIELAAARVRSLSVEEIDGRLNQRFRLLTGGSRTALPRQQTLRSLIDWSYELLTENEKLLLKRLSVFAGGWTLEAAERVCADGAVDEGEVIDLLTSLLDKSLIEAERTGKTTRYRLLETVRQYARDRLLESGGEEQRDRHLAYFVELAEKAEPHLLGAEQQTWFERLAAERDNLRLALEWSRERGDGAESGLRLAGAVWRFWFTRHHSREGWDWLSALLAVSDGRPSKVRATALDGAGVLAWHQGDYDAARALSEESMAIYKELGNRKGVADALNTLANVAFAQEDHANAARYGEECLAIRREIEDWAGISNSLNNQGTRLAYWGDFASAMPLYRECLAIKRKLADQSGVIVALNNLGEASHALGDYEGARTFYEECLATCREIGLAGSAHSLEGMAAVAASTGYPLRASRLWGAAERYREMIGSPLSLAGRRLYDLLVADARAALGDDVRFDQTWQEGRSLSMEQAVLLALQTPEE